MTRPTTAGGHRSSLSVWFPMALALSYVLISFTATPIPASGLVRPLIISVGGTLLLQSMLSTLLRRPYAAALITGVIVLIFSAAWLALGIAAAGLLWWVIVSWRRHAMGAPPMRVGFRGLIHLFGGVFWFMALVAAVPVIGVLLTSVPSVPSATRDRATGDEPDILVVLLDGYPRADALLTMGMDNTAFLGELEDRGFVTAENSRANYTSTWATLSSMFHGRHLEDIPQLGQPYPDGPAEQYRALMRLIREAPLLAPFRARGYEIITLPPPLEGAQLTAADRVVSPPQMTAFELSLIQRSPLGYLFLTVNPSVAYGQHQEWTEETLRLAAREIERDTGRPRFVFAHVTSPHPPMVANADGELIEPASCFPDCSMYVFGSAEDWERLPGQVADLNRQVLTLVDSVLAASPDAIVVLMSDHGMRQPGAPEADLFRSFFSIRSARVDAVPDDIQPIQVMRLLAGEAVDSQPYRAWISADERPLELTPYSGPNP